MIDCMINLEDLYSEVPPTKLRNIDEKFRPAQTSPFWLWVADRFFYGMLENRFYAFRYKGYENFITEIWMHLLFCSLRTATGGTALSGTTYVIEFSKKKFGLWSKN